MSLYRLRLSEDAASKDELRVSEVFWRRGWRVRQIARSGVTGSKAWFLRGTSSYWHSPRSRCSSMQRMAAYVPAHDHSTLPITFCSASTMSLQEAGFLAYSW